MTGAEYNLKRADNTWQVARKVHADARKRYLGALRDAQTSGMTLQAIGDVLGLSRQRVKQLLDKS